MLKRRAKIINNNLIKKILIIRLDQIGDLMLTAPMLKSIRSGFPNAKISLLVGGWNREVIENNALVDEVITFNPFWIKPHPVRPKRLISDLLKLRSLKFDMIISLRGELQERFLAYLIGAAVRVGFDFGLGKIFLNRLVSSNMTKHIIDRYLDIPLHLSCRIVDRELLRLDISSRDINYAKKLLGIGDNHNKVNYIILAPGAGYSLKLWDTKKFAKVADCLIRKDVNTKILIVGSSNEDYLAEEILSCSQNGSSVINLVGRTNVKELAAIVSLSSLVICLDSACMHIAASLHIPLIALFGPTKVNQWGPYPPGGFNIAITKNLACSGCVRPKCKVNECMQLISEDDVLCEANKIIDKQVIKTKAYA